MIETEKRQNSLKENNEKLYGKMMKYSQNNAISEKNIIKPEKDAITAKIDGRNQCNNTRKCHKASKLSFSYYA